MISNTSASLVWTATIDTIVLIMSDVGEGYDRLRQSDELKVELYGWMSRTMRWEWRMLWWKSAVCFALFLVSSCSVSRYVYLSGNLSHEIGTIGFGTVRRLKEALNTTILRLFCSRLLLPLICLFSSRLTWHLCRQSCEILRVDLYLVDTSSVRKLTIPDWSRRRHN